jgi:uncharacterized surface protein with fasciclin (FAS1) repeats
MPHHLAAKLLALLFGVALLGAACSDSDSEAEPDPDGVEQEAATDESSVPDTVVGPSLVEVASGTSEFSTLLELMTAANLTETLAGEGPFTVMAPTNDAFSQVPAATLEELKADPGGALTEVLQLHVIPGELDSDAVTAAAGSCVDTLGGKVRIAVVVDQLTFGGAAIEDVEVLASNGVVHFIDGVVTEPSADC